MIEPLHRVDIFYSNSLFPSLPSVDHVRQHLRPFRAEGSKADSYESNKSIARYRAKVVAERRCPESSPVPKSHFARATHPQPVYRARLSAMKAQASRFAGTAVTETPLRTSIGLHRDSLVVRRCCIRSRFRAIQIFHSADVQGRRP